MITAKSKSHFSIHWFIISSVNKNFSILYTLNLVSARLLISQGKNLSGTYMIQKMLIIAKVLAGVSYSPSIKYIAKVATIISIGLIQKDSTDVLITLKRRFIMIVSSYLNFNNFSRKISSKAFSLMNLIQEKISLAYFVRASLAFINFFCQAQPNLVICTLIREVKSMIPSPAK